MERVGNVLYEIRDALFCINRELEELNESLIKILEREGGKSE